MVTFGLLLDVLAISYGFVKVVLRAVLQREQLKCSRTRFPPEVQALIACSDPRECWAQSADC